MQIKLIIISILIITLLSSTQCKVRSDVIKTNCTKDMKSKFIKFYEKNIKEYNLLSLPEEFAEEDCFFLNVKDGSVNKVVLFMDVITTSPENRDQLIISQYDPSRPWEFETNTSLDIMKGSYNSLFLEEKNSSEQSSNRIINFLKLLMIPLIDSVDVNDYTDLIPFFKLSKMLGFENSMNSVFVNIADGQINKNLKFYLDNFPELALETFLMISEELQNKLSNKFESTILNLETQQEIEYITEHDPEELFELFQYIIRNMKLLTTKNGTFGRSQLAKKANEKLNAINGQQIIYFLSDYHKKIDKSKSIDWMHPSLQTDLNDNNVKKKLIKELEQIKDYEFQYYIIELFAMMGIKILTSKDKKAGMIEMVFSSSDKCLLTNFELNEMIQTAIDHQWVLSTTVKKETRKILRACYKSVNGNVETFVIKINPTGKSRCEIVIQRTDKEGKDGLSRELVVIPDTSDYYTYGNSCLRDTNRQKGINVGKPLSYYRNLL